MAAPSALLHRAAIAGLAAAALTGIGCAGSTNYSSLSYSSNKLATPPHNLPRHEYPFDDDGNYRQDWVRGGGSSSASRSASRTTSSSGTTRSSRSTVSTSSSSTPTPKRPASTSSSSSSSAPKPKPAPPKRTYHTVVKGDTLYGISRKYGVSVSGLKSMNGLSSDLIRPGQTLRIP